MKTVFYSILLAGLTIGCYKNIDSPNYKIVDGIYNGYFKYQGNDYWSSIDFDKNKYVEWPSGGAYYQKEIWCLTVGNYIIDEGYLRFVLDSFKYDSSVEDFSCNSDLLLPGKYTIRYFKDDSLIFEKDNGGIVYYLKRNMMGSNID